MAGKQSYRTKGLDWDYRVWVARRILTVIVIAALFLAGARLIGWTGQEWVRKYDLIGRFVLKSYADENAPGGEQGAPGGE